MRHRDFGLLVCDHHRATPWGHAVLAAQWGRLFEVTPEGEIVWEYVSPFMGPDRRGDPSNEVFRAYRYTLDSPQIRNRVKLIHG
jgi:hypothetical protein